MRMQPLPAFAFAVALLAGTPAFAGDTAKSPPAKEASIPFADHNGIRNFDVVDDDTLLIQSQNGKWYKAELFSPCIGLRFRNAIGFETNPGGSFDRWSAIRTREQRCPLKSLTPSEGPHPKAKAAKPDKG